MILSSCEKAPFSAPENPKRLVLEEAVTRKSGSQRTNWTLRAPELAEFAEDRLPLKQLTSVP